MSSTADSSGVLYVVATPIGNPGDISARALRVLEEVDLIACEDTRRTGQFLAAHGLRKPLLSHYEHNEERRVPDLVARLRRGARIALVTDAGTPAISDPGYRLVRAALDAAIVVKAIPGPSAAIAALSIAGLPTDRFVFEGFLPTREGALRKELEALSGEPRTMIFYEAARRLGGTLATMASIFGEQREAAVMRETTKTYEETVRGSLGELAARFANAETLGEITLVVAGAAAGATARGAQAISVDLLLEEGIGLKQASAIVARLTGRSRREVYQEGLKKRSEG
ncbi:MAG: 16S rRNA (cytidine(1402)-2'-O)-methyltransferase [Deltaproteobacteria bacterium]|nr:16S rRNA (cytidine(1402)-2'-O)-methyltransferase [Deltaproteobacteria bacterium]